MTDTTVDERPRHERILNPKPARSNQEVFVILAGSLAAVLLSLVVAAVVLWVSGKDATALFEKMWDNLTSSDKLYETVDRATPMIIAAVAVAIGFKMNLFNIGVEGQYLMGVFFAAVIGTKLNLPSVLHILLIVVIAAVFGSLWASIAAVLKVTRGVNEVIATIMLNALALNLIDFLFTEYFRFESASLDVKTKPLPSTAHFPELVDGKLNAYILVALAVAVLYWLIVFKSRFGYRLRASGVNAGAARTGGIAANRMIMAAMLLSGAIAGITGLKYLLADSYAYGPTRPEGFGFSGIAVALLGRHHPAGIVVSALLFGFLDSLSGPLQIAKIPTSIVLVIKAIILLGVVIVNEVVSVKVAKRTADRTAAQLAVSGAAA
ncbi:MAG TPA: sugar ABC transporter permease [Acidimicrobiaceae bacterium]|nr:sugar ABC transporter permease [Acidimicrobiaceae bacterium]